MSKYMHVIPLGFFCSPTMEIDKIGLRDASYPFDWLISDMEGIVECLENDFHDFLNEKLLYQYRDYRQYYINTKYGFHFYHDFSKYKDLDSQLAAVKEKYSRRIERFKRNIQEPTLFIRYIENQKEMDYILNNYEKITSLLKADENNDLILIANAEIEAKELPVYKVDKDEGDTVARSFLEKNKKLDTFLRSDIYDEEKRNKNIQKHKSNRNKKKALNYPERFINKYHSITKKEYIHRLISER